MVMLLASDMNAKTWTAVNVKQSIDSQPCKKPYRYYDIAMPVTCGSSHDEFFYRFEVHH